MQTFCVFQNILYKNYNMVSEVNQEVVLLDKNSKGKNRDWRGRKIMSLKLADVFENLGYKKSMIERIQSCGEVLSFIRQNDDSLT